MGLTNFSADLIIRHTPKGFKSVLELGAQNLYHSEYPQQPYADIFYRKLGFDSYNCIDLSGENYALKINLATAYKYQPEEHDLVTDFGTSEHIENKSKFYWLSIWNCWRIKHEALMVGGIMINENPKTGNWKGHGYNYYTQEFYTQLSKEMNYEILELGENAAMGNTTDGWNIHCVLKKTIEKDFLPLQIFKTFNLKNA